MLRVILAGLLALSWSAYALAAPQHPKQASNSDEFTTVILGDDEPEEPKDEFTTVILGEDEPPPPPKPAPVKKAPPPPPPAPKPAPKPAPLPVSDTSTGQGVLTLAYSVGSLGRVQLGGAYWFTKDWGLGGELGFDGARHQQAYEVAKATRKVMTTSVVVVPSVAGFRSLYDGKQALLYARAGVGPYFSRAARDTLQTGVSGQVGPGIDWRIADRISFHAEERAVILWLPNPQDGLTYGLAGQIAANWWFE